MVRWSWRCPTRRKRGSWWSSSTPAGVFSHRHPVRDVVVFILLQNQASFSRFPLALSCVQRSAAPKQRRSGQLRLAHAAARQKQDHQKENGSEEARPEPWVQREVGFDLGWAPHLRAVKWPTVSLFRPLHLLSGLSTTCLWMSSDLGASAWRRRTTRPRSGAVMSSARSVRTPSSIDLHQHCTRCTTHSCVLMISTRVNMHFLFSGADRVGSDRPDCWSYRLVSQRGYK